MKNVSFEQTIDFDMVQGAVISDVTQALRMVAEEVMTESRRNYVPVGDTGHLKRSAQVHEPVVTADVISIELGYGDASSEYAAAVHEAPDTKSDGTMWGQGKNKYLTKPLYAMAPAMPQKMAAYVKEALTRRGGVK